MMAAIGQGRLRRRIGGRAARSMSTEQVSSVVGKSACATGAPLALLIGGPDGPGARLPRSGRSDLVVVGR